MTVLNVQSALLTRRSVILMTASGLIAACARVSPQPADAVGRQGHWRDGPPLPIAVQEIYPALLDGRIHVAGGFVAQNGRITGPTDAHHVFDPALGHWMPSPSLPRARHHPHLVPAFGKLLVLGGFESPTADAVWVMQDSSWWLDPESGAWSGGPALPRPVGEAVTTSLDGRVHIAGGRRPAGNGNASWNDHVDTDEHFVLADGVSDWTLAAPIPTARNSAAGAVIGTSWHVVGGRTVAGGNTPAHEVYDPQEDRWRRAAPMPQAQAGLAATSVDGKLYAFGGEFFSPEPGGVFAQAWAYDPAADEWTAIPDMPHPRHGLGAVALGGDIFVIGGALGVGGSETSALVEIFSP